MSRVLLVEDEPSSSRYLRSLVESRCDGFNVVDTAENGAEALEKIARVLPDVVITDIRMPVMDGIELADRIARDYPTVYTVIVSGYQEFEYARRALHSRVVDYLLKPVKPSKLREVLATLHARIEVSCQETRVLLLGAALEGTPPPAAEATRFLPFPRYAAAVIRCGGLPPRRRPPAAVRTLEVVLASRRDILKAGNIWPVPGRDASEVFLFHAPDLTGREPFRREALALFGEVQAAAPTALFSRDDFSLERLAEGAAGMLRALDAGIVLGVPQVLTHGGLRSAKEAESILDPTTTSKIEYMLSNAVFGGLKSELDGLFRRWETERTPQVRVEAALRWVLDLLSRKVPGAADDVEVLLEEAFHDATSMADLAEKAWSIMAGLLNCSPEPSCDRAASALFSHIESYVRSSYAERLSLRAVSEAFGVSQAYLCRLFRRHASTSFNEFLTQIRVEAAKRLMTEDSTMPIKDVAAFVGYHDQFYFSRVFKSRTGRPPSEFARRKPDGSSKG